MSYWRLGGCTIFTARGRRTCKRWAFPVEVTEAVLNHISGSIGGVAGVYNLFRYDPQKRQALDAWASHLTFLQQGGQATNILPFARYG